MNVGVMLLKIHADMGRSLAALAEGEASELPSEGRSGNEAVVVGIGS